MFSISVTIYEMLAVEICTISFLTSGQYLLLDLWTRLHVDMVIETADLIIFSRMVILNPTESLTFKLIYTVIFFK